MSSASKDGLKVSGNTTIHLRINDLPTTLLFTIVKNLAIDVLLGIAFVDEQFFAILTDEQKVAGRNSTLLPIIKQQDASANRVFRNGSTQKSISKTQYDAIEGYRPTIRHTSTFRVVKKVPWTTFCNNHHGYNEIKVTSTLWTWTWSRHQTVPASKRALLKVYLSVRFLLLLRAHQQSSKALTSIKF